jgi:hypothetical protein
MVLGASGQKSTNCPNCNLDNQTNSRRQHTVCCAIAGDLQAALMNTQSAGTHRALYQINGIPIRTSLTDKYLIKPGLADKNACSLKCVGGATNENGRFLLLCVQHQS